MAARALVACRLMPGLQAFFLTGVVIDSVLTQQQVVMLCLPGASLEHAGGRWIGRSSLEHYYVLSIKWLRSLWLLRGNIGQAISRTCVVLENVFRVLPCIMCGRRSGRSSPELVCWFMISN